MPGPTAHPDWNAFMQAVLAAPNDDTPRLVAADWLEEHDQPDRAAFIRLQVSIAQLEISGPKDSPEAEALRRKERAFFGPLSVQRSLWAAEACPQLARVAFPRGRMPPLDGMNVDGADRVIFRRGFVGAVECRPDEWLAYGAAIREKQPVRGVRLATPVPVRMSRDDWYRLIPVLKGLDEVVLGSGVADEELAGWLRGWLPGTRVRAGRAG